MSRFVNPDKLDKLKGRERLQAVWYLQSRGELPPDVDPLSVEEIAELHDPDDRGLMRHTGDVDLSKVPNSGVVGAELDAGPERDDAELMRGQMGPTYMPESEQARRRAAAAERGEDWEGGNARGLFGDKPMELDTDDDNEQVKAANARIAKRRRARAGSSVHEDPEEARRRDPEHPDNVAEREATGVEDASSEAARRRDAARARRGAQT